MKQTSGKKRFSRKELKELEKKTIEKYKELKFESGIVWEKELSDKNFVCLHFRSINLQGEICYVVIVYNKITKLFSTICKINENGLIIKSFKDIASINGLNTILKSDGLLSYLAADKVYSN
jgi:hypothetical protein